MRRFQTITVAFALALQAMPVSAFAKIGTTQKAAPKSLLELVDNDPIIKKLIADSPQPTQPAPSAPASVEVTAPPPATNSQLSVRPYELSWEDAKRLIPGLEVIQVRDGIQIYGLIPSANEIKQGLTFSIQKDAASNKVRVGLKVTGWVKKQLEDRASSNKLCSEFSSDCQSISESGLSSVNWLSQGQDAEVHWSHHERRTDPTLVGALKEHDLKIRLKSKATLDKEELARLEKETEQKSALLKKVQNNCATCNGILTSESKIEEAKQALNSLAGVADQLKLDVEKITLKIEEAELRLLLDQAKKVKPEEAEELMAKLRTFDTDKDDSKRQEQLAKAYEQIAAALFHSKSEDESVRADYLSQAETILEEAKGLKLSKEMERRLKYGTERVKVEQESNELIPLAKAGVTDNTELQERLKKVQEGYMRSCYGIRQAGSMTLQTGVKMDQEGSEKCQRATLLMERAREIHQMAVNEEVKRQQDVIMNAQNSMSAGNQVSSGPFSARPQVTQGFAPSGMGMPTLPGFGSNQRGFGPAQAPSMMGQPGIAPVNFPQGSGFGQGSPVNIFPSNSGFGQAR